MSTYTTLDRHGYGVRFSPVATDHLLLASSQLFGLAGGGTLYLLQNSSHKGLQLLRRWEWSDGLFDVAWCPCNDDLAATVSGDGSVQLWALQMSDEHGLSSTFSAMPTTAFNNNNNNNNHNKNTKAPIAVLSEHKNEVYSIDWGAQCNFNHLLSASWDGTVKLWDCNRLDSLSTFEAHTDLIYCARFSPLIANLFSSVGTDGYINLWNSFDLSGKPLMSVHIPHAEILSCDWSKFDRNLLLTGASDGLVRAYDLRNLRQHVFCLYSGDFAVRRVACSPTAARVLATANYDFTTRVWDLNQSMDALDINTRHTEFVCGVDWNPIGYQPHQLADCGWDSVLNVYTPYGLKGL